MKVTVEMAIEKANEMAYNDYRIHAGIDRKATSKEWEKGDQRRAYIKINCYTLNGKFKGSYDCGYVDLNTDEYVFPASAEIELF
jgi:hypothetical protein